MARSKATQRIVSAAIPHFAASGYDGSSMAVIAEAVGIRKASLYAHFASKDALFMEAFKDALEEERAFAHDCFHAESAQELPGSRYCQALVQRFGQTAHLRFFLRTSYMQPSGLAEQIDALHEAYLEQLEQDFFHQLTRWKEATVAFTPTQRARYAEAYIGIVDSLQVKLIYTTATRSQRRLEAMLSVFRDSFFRHTETS